MIRAAISTALLFVAACAGPAKDVGAVSEGSGSGGSEDSSGGGSLSASSTTAATTQSDDAEGTGVKLDVAGGTGDEASSESGSKLDVDPGECACTADEICTPDGCFGGQVFLNFDGPMLSEGPDDSSIDQTSISQLAGQMQPYGGDDQERAALLEAVRLRFSDVSLWITDERPDVGTYAMIVLGDNLGVIGPVLEISPLNCGAANPGMIAFAAIYAGDGFDVDTSANIIAHGIGHTSGLDHVDDTTSIMSTIANPDATFSAGCVSLSGGAGCAADHAALCPADQEDPLGELQARFGAG
jgi:hypothetical protein